MKILYLTEDYLYSKVHNNMLITLLKHDASLIIYVFAPVREGLDRGCGLESFFKHHERLIEVMPQVDIPISLYKIDFWAKLRCKIRLIEKNIPIKEIDAIHAATLYTEGATALRLKKKYGIPYFVSIRGADSMFYDKKMPHLWYVGNQVIKHANKIASITPCIKESMLSVWQHRPVKNNLLEADIVNNGIDNIWLDNLNIEPKTPNNHIRLLYIGRFDSNKNVCRLIQAVKLAREVFNIKLTIIGGGGCNDEEHEIVMKEVNEHQDYIEYLGAIYDKKELIKIVRECDIFAMVSHSETFGLVYVECLSQGLPIVYSKGTGFDGMYPDGYVGYGVDPNSIDDIANGIKRVVDNYQAIRNNVRTLDFERYSWDYNSKKYLEYYDMIKAQKIAGGGGLSLSDIKTFLKHLLNRNRYGKVLYGHNSVPFSTYLRNGISMRYCNIGRFCYMGEYCSLNHVKMGNYCSIAPNVMIGGMEHSYWEVSTSPRLSDAGITDKTTVIGNDVWVGAQSIIKQGVCIGDGAVIGANSFVNKDVPPYSIVMGSPAKLYKYRFTESEIKEIYKTQYWKYKPGIAKQLFKNIQLYDSTI